MTDDPTIQYVKNIALKCSKQDLAEKLPECHNKDLISLLKKLLELNPFYRCSATEAISSNIFNMIRDKKKEKSSPIKLFLEIDNGEDFDYEKGVSKTYNIGDYKKII